MVCIRDRISYENIYLKYAQQEKPLRSAGAYMHFQISEILVLQHRSFFISESLYYNMESIIPDFSKGKHRTILADPFQSIFCFRHASIACSDSAGHSLFKGEETLL